MPPPSNPFPRSRPITRRAAPRYRFEVPVTIYARDQTISGITREISASGIRIEDTDLKPPDGLDIKVEFAFFRDSIPLCLSAEVVRTTETGGFAAEFREIDPRSNLALRTVLSMAGSGRIGGESDDDDTTTTTFSGKMVADLGPELHRDCVLAATSRNLSLKNWFQEQVREAAAKDLAKAPKHEASEDKKCDCPECRLSKL